MEKQLEHKINKAYTKKDTNSSFDGKDQLWRQISNVLGHNNGVSALWRVAAVILVLFLFGGVFGAYNYVRYSKQNQYDIEKQLIALEQELDSLKQRKPERVVKTIPVEKEKIVYREIRVDHPASEITEVIVKNLEKQVIALTNSLETANKQLEETKSNLEIALAENENRIKSEAIPEEKVSASFKLKTEGVKDQIQPDKKSLNPEMKVQLFKIQDNMRYDSNATLFKK